MENYFKNIFSTVDAEVDVVMDEVQRRIKPFQIDMLVGEITPEEVKSAVFSMNPDKAPGADGYTPGFYQKCWSIVGNDVIRAVKSFFVIGKLPDNLNDTI